MSPDLFTECEQPTDVCHGLKSFLWYLRTWCIRGYAIMRYWQWHWHGAFCTVCLVASNITATNHGRSIPCLHNRCQSASTAPADHIIHLQAGKHLTDNSFDPKCPKRREAPHTLEYWIDCPGTLQARLRIFDTTGTLPLPIFSTFAGKPVMVTIWCICI